MKSPFKFLDSYTRDDREIFFGRDREIEEMYQKVFESKILLVYGISGTGKTSLIDCGLANKFQDADWLPVTVRRGTNIIDSFIKELEKAAISKVKIDSGKGKILKAVQSIYLDHFKPVYLIFDQFEELFIFGDREEREEFIQIVEAIVESDIQCKFIFSIREEYLAGVTEFELTIKDFLANRMRIEKMTRQHAVDVIEGPCKVNGIEIQDGFAAKLLDTLNPDGKEVELTYLQVYLDKIYKHASGSNQESIAFSNSMLEEIGDVSDLLGSFLEEQISELDDPDTGLIVLKAFVSMQGTKKQIGQDEISDFARTLGSPVEKNKLTDLLQKFVNLRVLRDKDENDKYELRHDSLASKIYEKITLVEKELLEIKDFLDNAFMIYERRGVHLSEDDIKYILPYEDKLFLNKNQNRFITESREILERAKTRKKRIWAISASAIIFVLSVFTIWAVIERSKATMALKEKEIAEEKLWEASKDFVMSAENLNILYKGIENPVSFAIPGGIRWALYFESDLPLSLDLDSSGMTIIPTVNGIANITMYRHIDGDNLLLGTRTFRVMDLPDPVALVNGKNSGYILRDELAEMAGIDVVIRDFNYEYEFEVIGYNVLFNAGSGEFIYSVSANDISDILRSMFKKVNHNSNIHFTDIRVEGPDGVLRNLGSLTLTVVRWLDYGKRNVFYSLVEQAVQNNDLYSLDTIARKYLKKYYWDDPLVLNDVAYEYGRLTGFHKVHLDQRIPHVLEWSARSVELESNNHYYLDTYASLLYMHGRFDEAESTIRKAIRIAKEHNDSAQSYEDLLVYILNAKESQQ